MNVLYQCPECGGRLFAKPGGVKVKCRKHPESVYVQMEGFDGPDMLYVDEKGRTISKDKIKPGNLRDVDGNVMPSTGGGKSGTLAQDPDVELAIARGVYEKLMGEPADKRWGAARISEEVDEFMKELTDAEDAEEGHNPSDDPSVDLTDDSSPANETVSESEDG